MPNVDMCAQALHLLHGAGIAQDPNFIHVLGHLVRQSTEPTNGGTHLTTHYRSASAAAAINAAIAAGAIATASQYNAWCGARINQLRHEHMVPTKARIRDLGLDNDQRTVAEIAAALRLFGLRATITHAEDARLTQAGLKYKMPEGFYDPGNALLYRNPLARYIAIGLDEELGERDNGTWFG